MPEQERIRAGWRTWKLRRDILVSPIRGTEWPGPTLRAENWTCSGAVRGESGIHACWRLEGDLAYARVVGKIIPTDGADVVVGEDGWRAEEVRVVLLLLPKHTPKNVINALERRYQCDVRRMKYSDVLRQLLLATGTERALYKAYFLTPHKKRQERFEILRKFLSIGTIDALGVVAQLAPSFSREESEAIRRLMAIGTEKALENVIPFTRHRPRIRTEILKMLLNLGTIRALEAVVMYAPDNSREKTKAFRALLDIGTMDALEIVARRSRATSEEETEAFRKLLAIGTPEALKCVIHNSWAGSPEKKEAQAKLAALENPKMAFRQ